MTLPPQTPTAASGAVRLIAQREIRQRVRGRVFRFATVLLLLGVAAAVVIPAATKGKTRVQQVGVAGARTPVVQQAINAAGADLHTTIRVTDLPSQAAADDALRAGRIDLAVVDGTQVRMKRTPGEHDATQTVQLARAIAQVLGMLTAFREAGLSASQQAQLAHAHPLPVVGLEPRKKTTAGQTTAAVAVVVLFLMLTQYLTWTLIGVMEEKSSRVVEVLLSAVRPLQLLAGKVIGIGVVVFTQAAIVAAFALLLGRAVGSDLLHGTAPLVLASALLWLVLGYAFYSWIYAAAGSMAERQDQVQSLAIPLALPSIASYIITITVVGQGVAPPAWFDALGYVPLTAPFAMTGLVGLDAVAWWQFALSAALSAVSVVLTAKLAAGVYRRAVLRTGRRVRLREVLPRGAR